MIEWSWRIESEREILCGSWSDEEGWDEVFQSLVGRTVEDVTIHGRLPELSIALAGGLYVASFMTAEGQPVWTIFDKQSERVRWVSVKDGEICEDGDDVDGTVAATSR